MATKEVIHPKNTTDSQLAHAVSRPKKLLGPVELAKDAFAMFKIRFWTMVGIMVVTFVVTLLIILVLGILGVATFFLTGSQFAGTTIVLLSIFTIVGLVALTIWWAWSQSALLVALRDWKETSVRKSFSLAKPFLIPLFVVSLLQGLLVLGGYGLLFIPGIIFSIWFLFANYVVITEKQKGLNALHVSREYVRGRFWGVVWRSIAVQIPMIIVSIVFGSVSGEDSSNGISGLLQIINVVLTPFYMFYSFRLFENLKDTSAKVNLPIPSNTKLLYLLVPVIGYIIMIALGILIVPKLIEAGQSFVQNAAQMQGQATVGGNSQIKPSTALIYGIVQYYTQKGSYPVSLEDLVSSEILPAVPNDPSSGKPYEYTMLEDGKSFELCSPKGANEQKCIDPQSTSFDL